MVGSRDPCVVVHSTVIAMSHDCRDCIRGSGKQEVKFMV